MAKHEISGCIYSCRHLSFRVVMQSPLRADTHTPPPALMHFYCPHPLFLLVPSFPPAATSLSASAPLPLAWHPLSHPPHMPLPFPCTQLGLFSPHLILLSPADRPARPGIAPSTPRSPMANDFKVFFAPYPLLGSLNRRRQMWARQSSRFLCCLCHSCPFLRILPTRIPLRRQHAWLQGPLRSL